MTNVLWGGVVNVDVWCLQRGHTSPHRPVRRLAACDGAVKPDFCRPVGAYRGPHSAIPFPVQADPLADRTARGQRRSCDRSGTLHRQACRARLARQRTRSPRPKVHDRRAAGRRGQRGRLVPPARPHQSTQARPPAGGVRWHGQNGLLPARRGLPWSAFCDPLPHSGRSPGRPHCPGPRTVMESFRHLPPVACRTCLARQRTHSPRPKVHGRAVNMDLWCPQRGHTSPRRPARRLAACYGTVKTDFYGTPWPPWSATCSVLGRRKPADPRADRTARAKEDHGIRQAHSTGCLPNAPVHPDLGFPHLSGSLARQDIRRPPRSRRLPALPPNPLWLHPDQAKCTIHP